MTQTHAEYMQTLGMGSITDIVAEQHANVATAKATTKKQRVIDMLQTGTTVAEIAQALQISKVAARSLIGDVRHAKVRVTYDGTQYKLA